MKIVKDNKKTEGCHNLIFKYNKEQHKCHIKYQTRVNLKYVKNESKYIYFSYNLITCEMVCLNLVYCNVSQSDRVLITQAMRTINHYLNKHDTSTVYYNNTCNTFTYREEGEKFTVYTYNENEKDLSFLNKIQCKATITNMSLATIEVRSYERAQNMVMEIWRLFEKVKVKNYILSKQQSQKVILIRDKNKKRNAYSKV